MTDFPFLRLRLVGSRFESHSVPLDLLRDVAALEQMVMAVARLKFLERHPDRQRSPRGFTDGVGLALSAVGKGSATIEIELVQRRPDLLPPDDQGYFGQARDAIVAALDAAEHGRSATDFLPEQALSYFDRIGRGLEEDEYVEFGGRGCPTRACLTKDIRQRLIMASPRIREVTAMTSVRGTVPEVDQDDMSFEIQLVDGRKVKSPVLPEHLDAVVEVFNGYRDGMRASFHGIGRFSRTEQFLGFSSIEHLNMLDPLDIDNQLDDLRLLNDGWLDGEGKAPCRGGLDWLSKVLGGHFREGSRLPYLYPTESGGIRAEWSLGEDEITLDINLEARKGFWHHLDMGTGVFEERELACDDEKDWTWAINELNMIGRTDK